MDFNTFDEIGFSPNGRYVFIQKSKQKAIFVWDIVNNDTITFPSMLKMDAKKRFDDVKHLFVFENPSLKGQSIVWSFDERKELFPLKGEKAALNPEKDQIATAFKDSILLYDVSTGKRSAIPIEEKDSIRYIEYSLDGQYLSILLNEGKIKVWNMNTQECIFVLKDCPQSSNILDETKIKFSRDNTKLVAYDNGCGSCICLWDMSRANISGEVAPSRIIQLSNPADDISFNKEGTQLLTVLPSKSIVWDMKTGFPIHSFYCNKAVFNQNGTDIIMYERSKIHFYSWLPLQELIDKTKRRFINRQLTPTERREYYLD